jgi:hypothetical protein
MRVVFRASRTGLEAAKTWRSQVKARLYRTALTVSIVAILLEGLGAGWKW